MRDKTEAAEAVYRIGAVARLTGLSANTIRTWERRHGAVEPMRTKGGGRLYSDTDVERLLLLKQLTDSGDAISTLAELETSALSKRRQRREGPPPARSGGRLRVALLHRSLGPALAEDPAGSSPWQVCVDSETVADFIDGVAPSDRLDAVILDFSLLGPKPEAAYEQCMDAASAEVALVTYHFAARKQLDNLVAAGARVVRAPLEIGELKRLVHDQVFGPHQAPDVRSLSRERTPEEPAPPRYSEHQLYRLRSARPSIECECPHHLAELVETLMSFERYSAACASRSVQDRALHRTLQEGTARARVLIEDLLDLVVTHESIVV